MNKYLCSALVSVAFVTTGCGHPSVACSPRKGASELRLLKVDQAANDAAKAFKSGDHKLLGVYGFSVEIPGLAGDPSLYEKYEKDTRMLEGTGDVFCNKEEEDLNDSARAYAKKYNEVILQQLKAGTMSPP